MSEDYELKNGLYVKMSPPEELGGIPPRTEMTVLPADKPTEKKLGFMVYEVEGSEVYRFPEGHADIFENAEELRQYTTEAHVITEEEALRPGDKLIVPSLVGQYIAFVEKDDRGGLWAVTDTRGMGFNLKFVDDRPGRPPRWVSSMSYNLAALKKLDRGVKEATA